MTEAEWLACADPLAMLKFLAAKATDRKLRLVACACCRHIWGLLTDARSRRAIEVAELFADAQCDTDQVKSAAEQAERAVRKYDLAAQSAWDTLSDPRDAAYEVSVAVSCAVRLPAWRGRDYTSEVEALATMSSTEVNAVVTSERLRIVRTAELEYQSNLIRDIFGNPFRPVALNPAWLTSDVVALATGIYAERAFDRLPILADALQDAGCDSDDLLNHLRGDCPHVLGCWALDLVLGKS